MLPLQIADEAESTAQLALKASQAQQKLDHVLEEKNPPLTVYDAWDAYLTSHERPDSGKATLANYSRQWKLSI